MVLLPDPDRPVNHRVAPRCFSSASRSARETWPSCQVTLVARISVCMKTAVRGAGRFVQHAAKPLAAEPTRLRPPRRDAQDAGPGPGALQDDRLARLPAADVAGPVGGLHPQV